VQTQADALATDYEKETSWRDEMDGEENIGSVNIYPASCPLILAISRSKMRILEEVGSTCN